MSKEDNVTRRNFLKKSSVGLGSFGLGVSTSGLHASAKESDIPDARPEKLSPREDWITLESRSTDVRIKDICEKYDFVPHWDYIKKETKLQDNYR